MAKIAFFLAVSTSIMFFIGFIGSTIVYKFGPESVPFLIIGWIVFTFCVFRYVKYYKLDCVEKRNIVDTLRR